MPHSICAAILTCFLIWRRRNTKRDVQDIEADSDNLQKPVEESSRRPEHLDATTRMSTPLPIEEVGSWDGRTAGDGGSLSVGVALTRHTGSV